MNVLYENCETVTGRCHELNEVDLVPVFFADQLDNSDIGLL